MSGSMTKYLLATGVPYEHRLTVNGITVVVVFTRRMTVAVAFGGEGLELNVFGGMLSA